MREKGEASLYDTFYLEARRTVDSTSCLEGVYTEEKVVQISEQEKFISVKSFTNLFLITWNSFNDDNDALLFVVKRA